MMKVVESQIGTPRKGLGRGGRNAGERHHHGSAGREPSKLGLAWTALDEHIGALGRIPHQFAGV